MTSLFQHSAATNSNNERLYPSESDIKEAFDVVISKSVTKKSGNYSFEIPVHPKNVSIEKNMKEAHERAGLFAGLMDYLWFKKQVKNKGPWDYKQQGGEYQNFGNYNYGATGYAAGIPENILLRAAGWAQKRAGTSKENWGSYWLKEPYGDDPDDQFWIKQGIEHAKKSGY